ncbi:YbaB/EbfC family nucleoid-associated protein [Nonomuraea sp. NPDC049152]|uniref:YbaB/EbfC family nucleoid-associated protein n=1 Tax=Nonomuraea sp. NPDC049152 TaxID=3154350 RepID=UPI0033F74497
MDPGNIRDEDLEEAAQHAERIREWMEEAQSELDEIVGVGEGAAGQVQVTVSVQGRVQEVVFEPRAKRLDSKTLAEEVLVAVEQAQRDAGRQAHNLMRDGLEGVDPAEAQSQFDRLLGR